MRLLVVYKRSIWELMHRHRAAWARVPSQVKRRVQQSHRAHASAKERVCRALEQRKLRAGWTDRAELRRIREVDVVITVGGDGTVLRASHHLGATPLLGVNSDPHTSEGVLCAATAATFTRILDQWLAGRSRMVHLARLRVRLEGRPVLYPALNDVLFAHRNPAATSRVLVRRAGQWEEQVGSGVWVATAAGSTAAIHSAGARLLPRTARRFQYLLREPFTGSRRRYRWANGVLGASASLSVISLMREAALYVDGPHLSQRVGYGQRVTFDLGAPPLQLLAPTRGF